MTANLDSVFKKAAISASFSKSAILQKINHGDYPVQDLVKLLNMYNEHSMAEIPIIVVKFVSRLVATGAVSKFGILSKYINPENIEITVEPDELNFIINNQKVAKTNNIVFIVAKNILTSLFGISASNLDQQLTKLIAKNNDESSSSSSPTIEQLINNNTNDDSVAAAKPPNDALDESQLPKTQAPVVINGGFGSLDESLSSVANSDNLIDKFKRIDEVVNSRKRQYARENADDNDDPDDATTDQQFAHTKFMKFSNDTLLGDADLQMFVANKEEPQLHNYAKESTIEENFEMPLVAKDSDVDETPQCAALVECVADDNESTISAAPASPASLAESVPKPMYAKTTSSDDHADAKHMSNYNMTENADFGSEMLDADVDCADDDYDDDDENDDNNNDDDDDDAVIDNEVEITEIIGTLENSINQQSQAKRSPDPSTKKPIIVDDIYIDKKISLKPDVESFDSVLAKSDFVTNLVESLKPDPVDATILLKPKRINDKYDGAYDSDYDSDY